jgi:hypothetical protein
MVEFVQDLRPTLAHELNNLMEQQIMDAFLGLAGNDGNSIKHLAT